MGKLDPSLSKFCWVQPIKEGFYEALQGILQGPLKVCIKVVKLNLKKANLVVDLLLRLAHNTTSSTVFAFADN